jgi:transposase
MRKEYPSDITRDQFKLIEPRLKKAKKETHPPKYELYEIYCAIQYVLREGCRWRSLPHDFPPWKAVYYHYMSWRRKQGNGMSILDEILADLVGFERQYADGRPLQTTMVIPDSRSVKNADTAGEKGYDAGKKNIWHKAPHGSRFPGPSARPGRHGG